MSLHLYRRGRVWHYRGSVVGRRLRGSTGTQSKEIAQRIVADKEGRAWKNHLDGPAAVLRFADAAIAYRQAGKPDRFLKRVEDYWQNVLVKDIDEPAVHAAARAIYPSAGPASWNRQVIVPTQAVINFAAKKRHCARLTVARFKIVRREKEPATWEWVQAFMDQANSDRVAALACFMFFTAARVSEALRAEWRDVDLVKRRVLIRQTKVGAERWAHLPVPLFEALANMDGGREGLLFGFRSPQNCKTQWRSAIRRAGIKPLGYHACRHGFATAALRAGIPIHDVAKLGGWKTPALVLSTYGHAMEDATVTERLADTPRAHPAQNQRKIS